MTLQAGVTDDLWQWLLRQGWREIRHRPDRRGYRDVPPSLVTRLIDCPPDRRGETLAAAVAAARVRTPQAPER